ncbi:unnamed protein product, partial [Ixodes pacificus]
RPHPGPGHLRPCRLPRLPRPHQLLLPCAYLLHRCTRPGCRTCLWSWTRLRPRLRLRHLRSGIRPPPRLRSWRPPIPRILVPLTRTTSPGEKKEVIDLIGNSCEIALWLCRSRIKYSE